MSTFALLNANGLPAFCEDFPAEGTDICIPPNCDTYTVKPGDSSKTMSQATGLSESQILGFNMDIVHHTEASRSMSGYNLCVGPLGMRHVTKTATAASTMTPL